MAVAIPLGSIRSAGSAQLSQSPEVVGHDSPSNPCFRTTQVSESRPGASKLTLVEADRRFSARSEALQPPKPMLPLLLTARGAQATGLGNADTVNASFVQCFLTFCREKPSISRDFLRRRLKYPRVLVDGVDQQSCVGGIAVKDSVVRNHAFFGLLDHDLAAKLGRSVQLPFANRPGLWVKEAHDPARYRALPLLYSLCLLDDLLSQRHIVIQPLGLVQDLLRHTLRRATKFLPRRRQHPMGVANAFFGDFHNLTGNCPHLVPGLAGASLHDFADRKDALLNTAGSIAKDGACSDSGLLNPSSDSGDQAHTISQLAGVGGIVNVGRNNGSVHTELFASYHPAFPCPIDDEPIHLVDDGAVFLSQFDQGRGVRDLFTQGNAAKPAPHQTVVYFADQCFITQLI